MTAAGKKILESVRLTRSVLNGEIEDELVVHVPEMVDVRAIRAKLGLSQAAFARRFGFTPHAVRNWEQGRRRPEGSARVLLTVIDREPEAVRRALGA